MKKNDFSVDFQGCSSALRMFWIPEFGFEQEKNDVAFFSRPSVSKITHFFSKFQISPEIYQRVIHIKITKKLLP